MKNTTYDAMGRINVVSATKKFRVGTLDVADGKAIKALQRGKPWHVVSQGRTPTEKVSLACKGGLREVFELRRVR